MKMVSLRLRALRGGVVNLFVRGVKFVAGEWTTVPEALELEGGEAFPLVAYVTSLRDSEERALFEVPAEAEVPAAEEEAVVPADEPTGEASRPDAGAETITPQQLEAELAERTAVEAAQVTPETEGTQESAPAADPQPTGRRAQRMARRKSKDPPAA